MQVYLTTNGLQASDLVKPRPKKKEVKENSKTALASQNLSQKSGKHPVATTADAGLTAEQMAEEMARTILESTGMNCESASLPNQNSVVRSTAAAVAAGNRMLPSFSQVC